MYFLKELDLLDKLAYLKHYLMELAISYKTVIFLFILENTNKTAQKMKFSIKDFFSICEPNPQLVTFTEEILGNFIFCVV